MKNSKTNLDVQNTSLTIGIVYGVWSLLYQLLNLTCLSYAHANEFSSYTVVMLDKMEEMTKKMKEIALEVEQL